MRESHVSEMLGIKFVIKKGLRTLQTPAMSQAWIYLLKL